MVDAPGNGNEQFAVDPALHWNTDVRSAVLVLAMKNEILAARIVQILWRDLPGVRDPVSVLVIDVKSVELREFGHPHGEHLAKPSDGGRLRAVVFDAFDDADQRGVGLLDRVICLLGHCTRQIRRRNAHLLKLLRARIPAVPAVERQEGEANDCHEGCRSKSDGWSAKHHDFQSSSI
ncbi:hypothetical protein ABIC89_002540 [Variovorax boronicumulans]|uniref:hypothetical protein n=1 Tax=Variovorax boronicumulans TaxID=436515 RepID=UPI0033995401